MEAKLLPPHILEWCRKFSGQVVNVCPCSLFYVLRRKCREIVAMPILVVGGLGLRDYNFGMRGDKNTFVLAPYTGVVSEMFWQNRKLPISFAILCSITQMPRYRSLAKI